ncbi:antibiotic biosynthesis monooxygenase [Devosia sp.]|uniref:antibiotic biosynthesis monooxygenase family protein n=1 Tax=Devosia sp. TaxID=1871048 RepID=UPI001AD50D69|nr:antibiotic biosynthesis monooxygenase [Devosia sp.]MBN9310580.1 antibiotic biosynthesis monooxygenase [Devosia sp.]
MAALELVTFRLARGDAQQFVDANAPINDWLKRQPGFVSRHLAQRDDGSFIDIVFWQSHAAALAASAKMVEEMAQSEAMTMIDPMGLEMSHASIRLSVD